MKLSIAKFVVNCFFTAQRIKCKTFVDVSHNQWRLHAHFNCDPLTGFGKVIE